jgi:uncharacterized protein YchJ
MTVEAVFTIGSMVAYSYPFTKGPKRQGMVDKSEFKQELGQWVYVIIEGEYTLNVPEHWLSPVAKQPKHPMCNKVVRVSH